MAVSGGHLSLRPEPDEKPERDPVLNREGLSRSADMYLVDHPANDPYVSPVYGDFRVAQKPCYRRREILLPDAQRLAESLQAAGIPAACMWRNGCGMSTLYPVPEARGKP